MLKFSDLNLVLNRIIQESTAKKTISKEDMFIFQELLKNFTQNNNNQYALVIKIFLSFISVANQENIQNLDIDPSNFASELVNLFQDRETSFSLPTKNENWIILKIGISFIEEFEAAKKLIELARDLFKNTENLYGTAISNYCLAYLYYSHGENQRAARLLESIAHEFHQADLIVQCQYNAALLYYPSNIKRSMNLLENCIFVIENTNLPDKTDKIEQIESFLNKIRREYILKNYKDEENLFQIIEKLTISLHSRNQFLELAGAYYEAGSVLDKLGHSNSAEDYYIETARITAENEEWKLYSKSLIQLIIKFLEKGEIDNAQTYLNDLNVIATQLNDEELLKKSETLLASLNRLKANSSLLNASTDEIESILGKDTEEIVRTNFETPQQSRTNQPSASRIENQEAMTSVESHRQTPMDSSTVSESDQEVISRFLDSDTETGSSEIINFQESSETDEVEVPQGGSSTTRDTGPNFYNTRELIVIKLTDGGYETQLDYRPEDGGFTIDIFAKKGRIKKKKIYIMIAESLAEGELSANLLRGISENVDKYVYIFGPSNRNTPLLRKGVTFIFALNQLRMK